MKCSFVRRFSSQKSFSTLDLISESDIHLALLVGCNKSGCTWAEAALTAAKLSAVPVKVVIMWPWKVNITEGFSVKVWKPSLKVYIS